MGKLVHSAVKNARDSIVKFNIDPNFASSQIGAHYQEYGDDFWNKEVTPELIEELARKETAWWREQRGIAFVIGGATPAFLRAAILTCTAKSLASLQ
jgi:hypothetical protein